jgi:predicted enzyme related to lactoylglutathione lyase
VIEGFQGVIISTEDFTRLLPFYRDTLGLGTQVESDGFAVLGGGGQLALGHHSEVKGKSRDPNRMIVNLNVDNCQAEYERLKKMGVEFIREPSREAQDLIIATLLDPDGNTLQLFEWK